MIEPSDSPTSPLQAVMMETLLHKAPAAVIGREAVRDTTLGGQPIKKGGIVPVCPYWAHRNSPHWDHVDRFDPRRFLVPQADSKTRVAQGKAFVAFGDGPYECSGKWFALLEGEVFLEELLKSFRLEVAGRPESPVGDHLIHRLEAPCLVDFVRRG
jgi:cytochrome P450